MGMFDFAQTTKNMTATEILNYYRNLYYAEPQVTERGIVANAINDVLPNMVEVVRCKDCHKRYNPRECPMCVFVYGEQHDVTQAEGYCDRGERKNNDST